MQSFLIDTHVWLWLVAGHRSKASEAAWQTLEHAEQRNALGVSEVSFWEVGLKAGKGSLDVLPNARAWLKRASRTPGLGIIQVDREVMLASTELEVPLRDPADRMLIATALKYDLTLATADRSLLNAAASVPRLAFLDVSAK